MVEVTGYALPSGSNGPIVKVEVSADEGKTWWEAQLLDNDTTQLLEGVSRNVGELKWAWCRWKKWMRVERGKDKKIWSRATDASGNLQKESCDWNLRGVAYNGYGEASGLEIV
jgi:sulfite oxidase